MARDTRSHPPRRRTSSLSRVPHRAGPSSSYSTARRVPQSLAGAGSAPGPATSPSPSSHLYDCIAHDSAADDGHRPHICLRADSCRHGRTERTPLATCARAIADASAPRELTGRVTADVYDSPCRRPSYSALTAERANVRSDFSFLLRERALVYLRVAALSFALFTRALLILVLPDAFSASPRAAFRMRSYVERRCSINVPDLIRPLILPGLV